MKDFEKLFDKKDIVNKQVSGVWEFCKRGANYGVRLAIDKG